jgi:hypothetical protein
VWEIKNVWIRWRFIVHVQCLEAGCVELGERYKLVCRPEATDGEKARTRVAIEFKGRIEIHQKFKLGA